MELSLFAGILGTVAFWSSLERTYNPWEKMGENMSLGTRDDHELGQWKFLKFYGSYGFTNHEFSH